jgi:hypothetical protein
VVCLAPRALKDSVRPRRLAGVVGRPLNFTVRRLRFASEPSGALGAIILVAGCARFFAQAA